MPVLTAAQRGTGTSSPAPTPASKSKDEHVHVHAVELSGAERDVKYADQAQRYPQYAQYQRMTTRAIPVIALIPKPPTL
jgi:F420H(2)-dependent quinone reductase